MNRSLSISFIALATSILLMLAVVPHHHHQGMVCLVMERCEQDNTPEDTKEQDHADDVDHNKTCPAETEYVAPAADDGIRCKFLCCDSNHPHPFPLLYIVADFVFLNPISSDPKPDYGELIVLYQSTQFARFYGLRAPPRFIS